MHRPSLLERLQDGPCVVVGEVALAHDGSLGAAHAFVDAVADAGGDAVKFQVHLAHAESTPREPWRVAFSYQDATRYEYWRRTAFTADQWAGLVRHATDRCLFFVCSPFSPEAVDLLDGCAVHGWKIASGEVTNHLLLDAVARMRRPVLVSSGMSPLEELDVAVGRIRSHGAPVAVMQCTSAYPCPPERIGLNLVQELGARYGCPAGLSDHSGVIFPGLAAATLGARVLEVHLAWSRQMFGPDVPASLLMDEFGQLVNGVRYIDRMLRSPVDKAAAAAELSGLRAVFTRSVVAARDLPRGARLQRSDLALKKPAGGLPPHRLEELLGRRLVRDVPADEALRVDDIEPALEDHWAGDHHESGDR